MGSLYFSSAARTAVIASTFIAVPCCFACATSALGKETIAPAMSVVVRRCALRMDGTPFGGGEQLTIFPRVVRVKLCLPAGLYTARFLRRVVVRHLTRPAAGTRLRDRLHQQLEQLHDDGVRNVVARQ